MQYENRGKSNDRASHNGAVIATTTLAVIIVAIGLLFLCYKIFYLPSKPGKVQHLVDEDEGAYLVRKNALLNPYYEKQILHEYSLDSPVATYKTHQYDDRHEQAPIPAKSNKFSPRQYYERKVISV